MPFYRFEQFEDIVSNPHLSTGRGPIIEGDYMNLRLNNKDAGTGSKLALPPQRAHGVSAVRKDRFDRRQRSSNRQSRHLRARCTECHAFDEGDDGRHPKLSLRQGPDLVDGGRCRGRSAAGASPVDRRVERRSWRAAKTPAAIRPKNLPKAFPKPRATAIFRLSKAWTWRRRRRSGASGSKARASPSGSSNGPPATKTRPHRPTMSSSSISSPAIWPLRSARSIRMSGPATSFIFRRTRRPALRSATTRRVMSCFSRPHRSKACWTTRQHPPPRNRLVPLEPPVRLSHGDAASGPVVANQDTQGGAVVDIQVMDERGPRIDLHVRVGQILEIPSHEMSDRRLVRHGSGRPHQAQEACPAWPWPPPSARRSAQPYSL